MLEITFVPCTNTKPDRWRIKGHGFTCLLSCEPTLSGIESAQNAADRATDQHGRPRCYVLGEMPSGGYFAASSGAIARATDRMIRIIVEHEGKASHATAAE